MFWKRNWKAIWSLILVGGLVAAVLAGCGQKETSTGTPSPGKSDTAVKQETSKAGEPEFVFRYAEANAYDNDNTAKAGEYFCKRVEELTGGRVKVEFYPGGQLGASERQYGEQMMAGILDFAHVNAASIEGLVPDLGILNTPYLIKGEEHYNRIWSSKAGEYLQEKMNEKNLTVIGWFFCGYRNIFGNSPVKSLDDLKGLKLRTMQSEVIMDAWKALGAAPVPMPYGEVYSALQTGTVDAAENHSFAYSAMKFYEVAKYYNLTEHQGCSCMIVASSDTLKKLPDDLRNAVLQAGAEASAWLRGFNTLGWPSQLEWLKGKGVTIVEFDPKGVEEKIKPVHDKVAQKYGEIYQAVVDAAPKK